MAGRTVFVRKVKNAILFPRNFEEDLCADMLIL